MSSLSILRTLVCTELVREGEKKSRQTKDFTFICSHETRAQALMVAFVSLRQDLYIAQAIHPCDLSAPAFQMLRSQP